MSKELLIFIPTYNERDNVRLITEGLRFHLPDAPILFCDDNSPDGTYAELTTLASDVPGILVERRDGKLGIGSAHKFGIRYAAKHGYRTLLTLDCDLTHQPSDCVRFVRHPTGDVIVGTRFHDRAALADWNLMRKAITRLGHMATRLLLGIPYDATGALRRYRMDVLGYAWLDEVGSDGYAFFFESLMVLHRRGARIEELPIHLPKRTYGSSKMSVRELLRSCGMLLALSRKRFSITRK